MARGIISFVASTCLARKLVCCHFSQGLRAASCLAVLHICLRLKRLCRAAAAMCLPLSLSLSSLILCCAWHNSHFACVRNLFHFISCTFLFICGTLQAASCNSPVANNGTPHTPSSSFSLSLSRLPAFVTVFHMSGCHIFSFLARLPLAIAAQFSLLPPASSPVLSRAALCFPPVLTLSHHHCRRLEYAMVHNFTINASTVSEFLSLFLNPEER